MQLSGLWLSKQCASGNKGGFQYFSMFSISDPFMCLCLFPQAMPSAVKPRSCWSVGWWKERPPTGNSPNAVLSKFAPRSTPPGTSTQLGRRHGQPQVVFVRNGSVKTSSTKLAYIEYIEYNITLIQCFRASSILLTRVVLHRTFTWVFFAFATPNNSWVVEPSSDPSLHRNS